MRKIETVVQYKHLVHVSSELTEQFITYAANTILVVRRIIIHIIVLN